MKKEKKMPLFKIIAGIINGEILRNISIRKRLISAFILISVIPLIITGYTSYKYSSNSIKNKIETYSVQLMNQLGNNLNIELNKIDSYRKDIINYLAP